MLMVLTNTVLPQAASMAEQTTVTQEQVVSQDTEIKADDAIVLKVDKSQAPQTTQAVITEDTSSKGNTTDKEKMFQFGNKLMSYYLQQGKSKGPEWLKTTTFNFYVSEDFKPTYSLETIQPVGERNNDSGVHWFWQGRYAHSGDASTANLGVGWRNLAPDKRSLVGMNLFYDYGFQYDLARIGLGGEYFNKLSEYRFNIYHPVTGDKLTSVSYQDNGILYSYIRAVDGVDLEMGTSFSHAQWMKAFLKGYYYDNKHNDDEVGYQLRTTMQVSPRFNIELGYRHSNLTHEPYAAFKYQLADTMAPTRKGKAKNNDSYDLSDKLLQLVERDNDIKTETWTKFVAYRGSIKTTVTNSSNKNTAIAGATVQAYKNGAAVGSAAVTDDSGSATISGLAVGSYTVYVTYGSYSKTSDAVTVIKDTAVDASVSLDVIGGSATVTVVNTQSVGISGATVVATASSTTVAYAPKSMIDTLLGVKSAYAGSFALSVSTTTNANGVATFTNLLPGNYIFTTTNSSYSMKSELVVVASDTPAATTIMLPASGGNLRGVVKDGSGTVLSGATVMVLSGTSTVATGTTESNGVAILSGIAAGSYTVTAALNGYTSATATEVNIVDGETTIKTLPLTANSLTVTLKDMSGNAIANTAYSIATNGTTYTGTTSSTGTATLTGLPTTVTSFSATATGYGSTTGTISWSGSTGTASVSMTATSVAITLTNESGVPIGNTAYTITANGSTYTGTTTSDGKATLTGLPTTVTSFTATATGYGSNTGTISWSGSTGTANVSVTATSVAITLTNASGTPIGNTAYTITANDSTYTGTTTSDGKATLTGLSTTVTSFTITVTDYESNTGTISWSGSTGTASVSMTATHFKIYYTCTHNGTAIANKPIEIFDPSGRHGWAAVTDSNGKGTLASYDLYIFTNASITAFNSDWQTILLEAKSTTISWSGKIGTFSIDWVD